MLSAIIVNYRNAPLLRLCLKSLTHVLPLSFSHEIIVVDVAAQGDTAHVAQSEFAGIRYLSFKENIGYTRGVNEGIKAAKGDVVFICNPDIIPLENSLQEMYAYIKDHPEIGLLGPQLLNFDGSNQPSCFRFYTPLTILCRRTFIGRLPFAQKVLANFAMKDKDLSKPTPADWLTGSALMASKKAASKVGPMDERLFLYFSDVDWPRQFWENGYQVVFYPAARMFHYHGRFSRGNIIQVLTNKFTRIHIADGFRYFKKYGFASHSFV